MARRLQRSVRGGWLSAGCGYTARGNGRSARAPAARNAGAEVVIKTLIFPGGYRDQAGYEAITWRVEGSRRYNLPSLDFRTTIRGINLQSADFDSLEPVDPSAAAGKLPLSQVGELTDCVLCGDLPCTIAVGGQRRPAVIAFSLDLHPGTAAAGPGSHAHRVPGPGRDHLRGR
jgi:Family of unknown function (DUF6304)